MLRFADDFVLSAEKEVELGNMLDGIDKLLKEEFGLNVKKRKTRVILKSSINITTNEIEIRIRGHKVEEVA